MPTVNAADDALLQELLQDGDYLSLCDAFQENYLIIKGRSPDMAKYLKDSFWNERYQCWNLTERALGEIWDIESDTRPGLRRKKSSLESILQRKVPVELILRFVSIAAVLAFVIKIRFFSS